MNEHELSELLELADRDHPLPGDLEDDLLAAILTTYRQAPAGAELRVEELPDDGLADAPARDERVPDVPGPGDAAPHDAGPGGAMSDDEAPMVVDLTSRRSRPGPRRVAGRRWLVVAGAAAAAIVAVFLVARNDPPPTDVAIAPTSAPAVTPPVGIAVAELTDTELCTALTDALDDAALVGTPVLATDLEAAPLEQVVAFASELVERRRTDGTGIPDDTAAVDRLIVVTENLRLELERGTDASADAAYRAARTTASEATGVGGSTVLVELNDAVSTPFSSEGDGRSAGLQPGQVRGDRFLVPGGSIPIIDIPDVFLGLLATAVMFSPPPRGWP